MIVKDGVELGRGSTQAPGSAHAEISAINDVYAKGMTPEGATFYVTLEPCSHYGRTPPCALRLIKEKAARVVVGTTDPNPLVAGRGIAMLKDAGIAVTTGVCETEAIESNIGFITRMKRGTPWVRMKLAASLDGRTALENGMSRWITSEDSREDGRLMRAPNERAAARQLEGSAEICVRRPGLDTLGKPDSGRRPLHGLCRRKRVRRSRGADHGRGRSDRARCRNRAR